MAKRRFVKLLPAFNQTAELTNFFGSTVDEVFQPGTSIQVSGYIGEVPTYNNPATDFYVAEPTASRAAYQLEPGMVSFDTTGVVTNALSYPDFVAYLAAEGANVTNHQRMFETDYYSWAPPISIDMIVNYREYYWFGDISGAADLPILVLTIPMATYTGNGTRTTFALPVSINAVAVSAETPAVYVNNVPVAFTVSGNSVVLTAAPTSGASIIVCRTPNFVTAISGQQTVNISDINSEGVTFLSSTMRIKVVDAFHVIGAWDEQPWDYHSFDYIYLWDESGDNVYMVDGVGLGIRLTPDNYILRGLAAQYITIDRSSLDGNLWSLHNSWVHGDSFAWSGQSFADRQAVRPIIEFVRDIVLYSPQTWQESVAPLFMLYDLNDVPLNDAGLYPASNFTGNPIFGYAVGTTPSDPVLQLSLAFDANGYPLFQNDIYALTNATPIQYQYQTVDGSAPILGMYLYGTNDGTLSYQSVWHPAYHPTTQGVTNGFYDIPLNLQANPSSEDVTQISRSTWVGHFTSIIANQPDIIGQAMGDNNWRDTGRDLTLGSDILQHRAPVLKAMLCASDDAYDIPEAIRYVDQQYNMFRNKFITKLNDLNRRGVLSTVDPTVDPNTWVITALNAIKQAKSVSFPFALNTIGGGQYFIPPTPAALGIMPTAVPTMITDNTDTSSTSLILGHDGSLTPAFGDWHDNVLLALEQLIYTNLPPQFQTDARPVFDIQQWIGGVWYSPFDGYSFFEVSAILVPLFEIWAQNNQLDYRTNADYDPTNPFTWNFNGVADIFGNLLPGNWRAIYRFYYGTDAPHLRPWEMLGFTGQPTWWETTYGAPPYTLTNTALWTDLQNGTIAGGVRMGTDVQYARTGLANLIPVDADGNLLNPVQVGIVTVNVPLSIGARPWQAGDQGPVENMWITSPSYRFALALASFLMKPARFVEECWSIVNPVTDTLDIGYIGPQWVEVATLARPLNALQYVHGETLPSGATQVVTGLQQWLADMLMSGGNTVTGLGTAVRGLDVRLLHQMAGFVSSDQIQAVADNFGLLPSEDVNVFLYQSPTTDIEVYSGVILEWTGAAWQAIGYDARNPWFTVIPGDPNGPKGVISLATAPEPVIVEWRMNTYYPFNILADYRGSVYQCIRSHTSGSIFESTYWESRPDLSAALIRAPRVITYQKALATTQTVPYGSQFTSYQAVGDFLLGWQRWLVSRGWIFDQIDPTTGTILDWSMSVKEFLNWAQVQWQPGNFIALSPGMSGLKFFTANGTILNVEDNITGFFGLLDRSGKPIPEQNVTIDRLGGLLTLAASAADIYAARLEIAEIEHALVFSNVTIFNDDVYLPLFDMRQDRLWLTCNKSTDWAGRMDAPGYIIIGNQLRSSFAKAADDVRLMFDIELADQPTLRNYARHDINFVEQTYLNNLLLSDTEQFEFYQGMIEQKGAPGAFQKLMRSTRASSGSDSEFLEEWAFRIDAYGAPLDPFITFQLQQVTIRDDPQIVRFVAFAPAPPDWIIMPLSDQRWSDLPASSNFFATTTVAPALPNAGPVRLSDVVNTAFYLTDIPTIYTAQTGTVTPFPAGSRTWVYEQANSTYTVLESFETSATPPNAVLTILTNAEDDTVTTSRVIFQQTFNITTLDVGDYLIIDGQTNTTPNLQGPQIITAVNVGTNSVDLQPVGTQGHDFTSDQSAAPLVRILRSVRFADTAAIPAYPFATGDLVWVDNYASDQWAVLQWSGTAWVAVRNQPPLMNSAVISETVVYEQGPQIVGQQMIVNQPVIDDLDVIDPMIGLLAGICQREIDFRGEYDPAQYNNNAADGTGTVGPNPWGAPQVGRVWWNLATVKFLSPYTDTLGVTSARDLAELTYRVQNWASIAPNASVDVYEWVQSNIDPITYAADATNPGTVYNAGSPSWVEETVFDPITGAANITYYFWVEGLTTIPNVSFRNTAVATVAQGIINPSGLDLAWMAPIATDSLIVSGVTQYLNDTSTVMKVRQTLSEDNPERHDEWTLLRPTDPTSLPTDYFWAKLRDSLAGFNADLQPVPSPNLSPARNTGISALQSMFTLSVNPGDRLGLMDARQTFVGSINNIFAQNPVVSERQSYLEELFRPADTDPPLGQYLIWSQADISYPFEPPPSSEWEVEVFTSDQRNRLLGRSDFLAAVDTGTTIRVLINGQGNPVPNQSWSIWTFNPTVAATVIGENPSLDPGIAMLQNADTVFQLATAYEWVVNSEAAMNALVSPLVTISVGDRVLVTSDTLGFWAIWKYLPASHDATANGFVLWRVQPYRTSDFIDYVDWYASGYSASNPPIISYATIADRDAAENANPINIFVKIDDDGTGHWIWTALQTVIGLNAPPNIPEVTYEPLPAGVTTVWQTVAIETGTIALSSNFYNPANVVHGVNTVSLSDIANRDGSWELYILVHALNYTGMLLDTEINQNWFDMVNFCHVQQADVDWAFKTSFINIVGYNVPLAETPYAVPDQTDNLISYVNEVKPYRVKIREFSTQYNPAIDEADTTVTDFDKPVYLDPLLNIYRTLDPTNPPDQAILATLPWQYWYDNYQLSDTPVRGMDITLLFDRYVGLSVLENWDVQAWDSTPWDPAEQLESSVYVHTTINQTLTEPSAVISVDDVRFMTTATEVNISGVTYQVASIAVDDVNVSTTLHGSSGSITTAMTSQVASTAQSGVTSLTLSTVQSTMLHLTVVGPNIANETYPTLTVTAIGASVMTMTSTINVVVGQLASAPNIPPGTTVTAVNMTAVSLSAATVDNVPAGTLVTFSTTVTAISDNTITLSNPTLGIIPAGTNFTFLILVSVDDGTLGNLVEAVVPMPTAAERIIEYYNPSPDMAPNDLTILMNLGMRSSTIVYPTTIDAPVGSTVLTFSSTTNIAVNQSVNGPNIIPGTTITAVTATTVTLSAAPVGDVPADTMVTFTLPNWLDGYILQTFEAPISEFDLEPFDEEEFDTTTTIYDITYDGSTLSDPDISIEINPPQTSQANGLGFYAPYFAADHPEERVPFTADDGLQLIVTANPDVGGPPQIIKAFNVSTLGGSTATLFFELIAQAASGVMVFLDGVRATLNVDYTVDHFERSVTVDITGVDIVSIHGFGFGGDSVVNEQHFVDFADAPITLDADSSLADVMVVENGVLQNSSQYSVSGNQVTLTSPPASGAEVAVVVFAGGTSTATIMTTQDLTYNVEQQWTLDPRDAITFPEYAGTIVEVNGKRLAPSPTFYGHFTVEQPWMYLPLDTISWDILPFDSSPYDAVDYAVYIGDVAYTAAIPVCTSTSSGSSYPLNVVVPSGQTPPTDIAGQFVLLDNVLIALQANFTATVVVVPAATTPDYTVQDGGLTIDTSVTAGDTIVATTFSNADSMLLETVVFPVVSDQYYVPMPFAKGYALVAMNGLELAPDFDYEITAGTIGWDSVPFDTTVYDFEYSTGVLDIFTPTSGNIVATITTGQVAREAMQWRVITDTPAFLRMPPAYYTTGERIYEAPPYGGNVQPTYQVMFEYTRQTPYMAGSLAQILNPDDTQIVVTLFLETLSVKLQEPNPMPVPNGNIPGVVWLFGERIEYFGYTRSGDTVTVSGVRRGTRGTTIAEQRVVTSGTGTGSSQTYVLDASNGTGPVEVAVSGVLSANFTTATVGDEVQVSLTAASGAFVTVAMTIGYSYPVGTAVYNGVQDFAIPVPTGVLAGDREVAPMQQIIAG